MKAMFAGALFLFVGVASANVDLILGRADMGFTPRIEPGSETTFTYHYSTKAVVDARLIFPFPGGARLVRWDDPRWQCTAAANAATCTRRLDPQDNFYENFLSLTIAVSDDPAGTVFTGQARLESDEPDPLPENNVADAGLIVYHTFTVSTPDDFGAGSLRDAMGVANAQCGAGTTPCKIRFAAPMRIAPSSPLPRITACDLLIDGGGYDALKRNRSFDAPRRVEISGENAGAAHGFIMASPCGNYRGAPTLQALAIHSFQGNGVEVEAPSQNVVIQGCSIGTDAAGTTAMPNTRGINVDAPGALVSIVDCLVAGNDRSGIFFWQATSGFLYGNLVGVRFGGIPMPNGASGIYLNDGTVRSYLNAIEYNHDFGVAVGPGAAHYSSTSDYIALNGGIAIDWGLDGPSGPTGRDKSGRMPPVPQLLDAYYDRARNKTYVTGVLSIGSAPFNQYRVIGFVSSGDYEGGLAYGFGPFLPPGINVPFTLEFQGNRTGQTITASTQRYPFQDDLPLDTSELSAGIVVR
jgi:hypothetical protein